MPPSCQGKSHIWTGEGKVNLMKEVFFPPGTRRRRIFDLTIASKEIIQKQGLGDFWTKAKNKIRKKIIFHPWASEFPPPHYITPRKFSVLFLIFPWAEITNRYRVYNMREYLLSAGIPVEIASVDAIEKKIYWVLGFDIVVIHRIPLYPALKKFIKKCRALGIPVIFDLDDYIFNLDLIDRIELLSRADREERKNWVRHFRGCRETLLAADYFFGTTEYLADRAREIGSEAFVIRNGLNRVQLQESQKALGRKVKDPGAMRLGYFSGTKTHQKDFQEIQSVLLKVLEKYPHLRLVIGGFLDLDPSFQTFSERVECLPYVEWQELPHTMAPIDINLVPLESGNPFNQAKSELKYFEAALLKIPTIASPTEAFQWAIKNGENGFLAATEEEWYAALIRLVEDKELREKIGEAAYQHVMKTYAPASQACRVKEVYQELIRDYRKKKQIHKETLSLSFLLPAMAINDQKGIWTVVQGLMQKGHRVKIYTEKPEQWVLGRQVFQLTRVEVANDAQIYCCDVLIIINGQRWGLDNLSTKSDQILHLQVGGGSGKDTMIPIRALPQSEEEITALDAFLKQITASFPESSLPGKR